MHKTPEQLFELFDQAVELVQADLSFSYLDAYLENAENLVDNGHVRVEDGLPKPETVKKLQKIYADLDIEHQDSETVRRLLQLCLLKVMRKDAIQANHQMTPDTIGMLFAYLIEQIVPVSKPYKIFDPVVGTGNLLTTVINHLTKVSHQKVEAYGIDNDDSMLAAASVSADLQHLPVQLIHQDSITNLDIPQCDLAVADLPVGYYPLDDNVKNYQTKAAKGHSYVHHLLIEQTMNYIVPGGFAFFVVPSDLFKTKETASFVKWIQSVAYMQGFINLPSDMFSSAASQKSILILQNHGKDAKQAQQVLLGTFPSLKDQKEFRRFLAQVDQWVKTSLKN